MRKRFSVIAALVIVGGLLFGGAPQAVATGGAVIDNGTIMLGVHDEGHLNVYSSELSRYVGLTYIPTGNESTAPGCLCEGWGVADQTSGVSGWANEAAGGTSNLTTVGFTATDSSATSVVDVGTPAIMQVTHDYQPSVSPNLYEVTVSVQNTGTDPIDLRYRRVMDWDVEPTAFSEFVTIETGTSTDIAYTSDDGFASPDPLAGPSSILFEGDAVDSGPADHGALWDFAFGTLDPGATRTFSTFYGAASTEADANAALATVGAEAFSYGQPDTDGGPDEGTPNTFIFAFGGVGGDPLFCAEDGLDALDSTPLDGVASGAVHETAEPAVGSIDSGLADTVHGVNCDVLVPLEDEVDALLP